MFRAAAQAAQLSKQTDDCEREYRLGETLGTGSFATVKKGVDRKTGAVVAVKVIDKTKLEPEDIEALETETEILKLLSSHKNIVSLFKTYSNKTTHWMVMELMSGGELFDRVVEKSSYSEGEAARTIKQVTEALLYCHQKGIAHRDLKPENLLYETKEDDSAIKLADFGLAKGVGAKAAMNGVSNRAAAELLETACGTPGYVAPEVLTGEGYGLAVDVWSVGVILYILLCGFPPFYSEDNNELFEAIKKGAYDLPSPYWDNVSEAAKDLVAKCLTVDPKKRLTAQQVLAHPWVVSGGKASSSTAPSLHRDGTVELHIADNLRKFNARRRFREGIRKVQALTRLRRLGKMAAKRQAINLMSSVSATTPTTASGAPSTARPMSAASPTSSTAYTSGAATTTTGMSIRPSSAVGVAGRHSLFGGTAHAASVAAPASSPVPSRFAPAHNALSGATSTAATTSSAYSPAARHSLPPPSSGGGYGYSGIYSSGAGSGAYGLRY